MARSYGSRRTRASVELRCNQPRAIAMCSPFPNGSLSRQVITQSALHTLVGQAVLMTSYGAAETFKGVPSLGATATLRHCRQAHMEVAAQHPPIDEH